MLHNNVQGHSRLLRVVLTRFSEALGIMTTVPVVVNNHASGTFKVIVGYIDHGVGSPSVITANLVNIMADYLSHVLGGAVQLVLIKVDHHYSDATLLAQYLSGLIGGGNTTSHTFKAAVLRLTKFLAFTVGNLNDGSLIGTLKGIRVVVSGRLATEPTRPRQTVQEFTMGSFSGHRLQASSFTTINAKGSMTVKVWLAMLIPSPREDRIKLNAVNDDDHSHHGRSAASLSNYHTEHDSHGGNSLCSWSLRLRAQQR